MRVSTVSKFVREIRKVIWNVLQDECPRNLQNQNGVKTAKTVGRNGTFLTVQEVYMKKKINQVPRNSSSQYYNNKQYFSILLQALVDADCKLKAVEIEAVARRIFQIVFIISFSR
jgi:hypothetical protein